MELVGFEEMFTIVKGLKRGKAPGPDSIDGMLEYGGSVVFLSCPSTILLSTQYHMPCLHPEMPKMSVSLVTS